VPPGYLQLRSGSRGSSRGVICTGGGGTRINVSQMPRPASSPDAPAAVFETRQQGKHAIPPPSSDDFAVGRGDILVDAAPCTLHQQAFLVVARRLRQLERLLLRNAAKARRAGKGDSAVWHGSLCEPSSFLT